MNRCARHALPFLAVLAAIAAFAAGARADIGGTASRHNISEVVGYGFGDNSCSACHKPHGYSGKRLWSPDKEAPGDGGRGLAAAKTASLDQAAGGEYPGIYLCLDCHGGTASSPAWSQVTGFKAMKVATHSTREMQAAGYATKRGSFVVQCTTCHDPHQTWDGSPGADNLYMIRPAITTPSSGGRTVVFSSFTGAGSMGTNTNPYQAVCEVCHTQTTHHDNTGSPNHHDGKDCRVCHGHAGGFAATGCDACHGDPPVSFATLVGRSANPGDPPTGATTAGKHAFHTLTTAGGAGYACDVCHTRGMGSGGNADMVIDINFSAFGVSTSGRFDGFSPISGYTFSAGNTTGGTLGCANTYCHGNFPGGVTSNTPAWDDASTGDCGTCHGVTSATLADHSVHLGDTWGPKAACDDCHPASSSTGRHSGHVDGDVDFKDGQPLSTTAACAACHGSGTADAKGYWGGGTAFRGTVAWCEGCHDGSSTVNTVSGTGGVSVTAPDVVGDALSYGFDVSGHGSPGIGMDCASDCHVYNTAHINRTSVRYRASSGNYKAFYRLSINNDVPLLGAYSSARVGMCYYCHTEANVVGMPAEGRPSALHVHSTPIGSTSGWKTNFRNMSTYDGKFAGNWDSTTRSGYTHDVPTNIHWNHMDDYGSSRRDTAEIGYKLYDSDGDGTGDSYMVCESCHNPHGTNQKAMVHDDFALGVFSALVNQSVNPSYMWLGSDAYSTTRCTYVCHANGDADGTAGTKWYREPVDPSTIFGIPIGLTAVPLQ
ncbi:MAG: CxxxxCH/CxxCH domain-containing protein [Nitrospirae bacterium]|nr:CxxxxCH/CxxCH domain-containing protein [Nitrospirota bacterium]